MKCPQCGSEADGKFCAECGSAVAGPSCPSCEAAAQPGASFCIFCGTRLRRRPATANTPRSGTMWVGGALVGVLILVVGYWTLGRDEPAVPSSAPLPGTLPPAAGPASSVDLTSMTPRQAADRLYDRIMRAASAGDTTEALAFLPMAINAYDLAVPLDADGHYHVSLLHALGTDYQAALEIAEQALEQDPSHLLLLGAAARAAAELGDDEGANGYHERLLAAWDEERARGLEEYSLHTILLTEMRQAAETRGGG